MIAKIVKLDEYLAELVSINKPSIVKSIMNDMGVDEKTAKILNREMTFAQELQMMQAHLGNISDEQKRIVSHVIMDPMLATMNNQPFGGIDIAEGYNFRRVVANDVARNNILDLLKDNGVKYLIDYNINFRYNSENER